MDARSGLERLLEAEPVAGVLVQHLRLPTLPAPTRAEFIAELVALVQQRYGGHPDAIRAAIQHHIAAEAPPVSR